MSERYKSISWNRQKRIYDAVLGAGIVAYILIFVSLGSLLQPYATIETLLIRGFGTCAILMLHIALIIGPLCRLWPQFLTLLYNRRHLGVATFLVASVHGMFSIFQFHALGNVNPILSVLISNTRFGSVPDFPFQILGFFALIILFLMAATSHDFWLNNLTAPIWKTLHTLVYPAYGLVIAHVALGVLQAETSPILTIALGSGIFTIAALHIVSGFKEMGSDLERATGPNGFVDICSIDEIPENRALVACVTGERVAIFKYAGKISAVSNVCQHQNGPLGEGRIIDGCITCPWHGFQYLPETGASPAPFTEKVPTFNLKIEDGRIFLDARPNKPGTRVEPIRFENQRP